VSDGVVEFNTDFHALVADAVWMLSRLRKRSRAGKSISSLLARLEEWRKRPGAGRALRIAVLQEPATPLRLRAAPLKRHELRVHSSPPRGEELFP
jgi:hypothetical protein